MASSAKLLVVANRTVDSDELFDAVTSRCRRGGCSVTLLVPASWDIRDSHGGRETARRRLREARARLRDAGVRVECVVGDADPVSAVEDLWDPARFDEVIVSTLPSRISSWLKRDLPARVAQITEVPVTHVVASERRPVVGGREA